MKQFYDTCYVIEPRVKRCVSHGSVLVTKHHNKHLKQIMREFYVPPQIEVEMHRYASMVQGKLHSNLIDGNRSKVKVLRKHYGLLTDLLGTMHVTEDPKGSVYNYLENLHAPNISEADRKLVAAAVKTSFKEPTILYTRDSDILHLGRCLNRDSSPVRHAPMTLAIIYSYCSTNHVVNYGNVDLEGRL